MCFPESIAYDPEEIALALSQRGAFSCIAEVDEHVVAFILAYQKKPQIGHIVTLDVHPDFRRQSIGHHLMERAEERLRERGAERIILEVAVSNETAQRFYEKRGYLRQKLLRHYYADRSDAYLMEKKLSYREAPGSVSV
jgi:[ribosomal protein S18]-alanine N-acetyltransferase